MCPAFQFCDAKLDVSERYGNTKMTSDIPFFTPQMVGGLMRLEHENQSGIERLGNKDAVTDAIELTGISDTGAGDTGNERFVRFDVSGTYSGTVEIQRSFDGPDIGFHEVLPATMEDASGAANQSPSDTGTFTRRVRDRDDNLSVYYRAKMTDYTSGTAFVTITAQSGQTLGIGRITGYNNNQSVNIEVLSRFADTGATENWREGAWSSRRGFPTAVALHEGRLAHAGGAQLWLSASDDFNNFDDQIEGDSAPIIRTFGSGPVDNIFYLLSLQRLIAGTAGSEVEVRSSSFDEVLTPSNSSAKAFSTQGSANLRALKRDNEGFYVQRSTAQLFRSAIDFETGGFRSKNISVLVPELLNAGVVSIALQRQPDTRLHCVLGDGTVAILTYEPEEDVLAWSIWETNGSVERAAVLPGTIEDNVYYLINRTINGQTKRFVEKWAMESESIGDTGLSYLADCAASYTDTGRTTTPSAWSHLAGEAIVAWGDDTGQSDAGRDLSPDVNGVQTTYTVDTGGGIDTSGAYENGVHHTVGGLPYTADWKSAKLAWGAEAGTALAQMKRTDKIGFVLCDTHNNGLFFGSDTGNLDPMPRVTDEGERVDVDKIFSAFDQVAMPFPGEWNEDARIHLRAKAPRPATVLAAIPTVNTEEKV
jgi:hypothetical protein